MATILIVEDDEDIRNTVSEILREQDYDVREAEDGKQALEVLESMGNEPCLVLLDLMMPEMSGTELLQVLHETHRLASLPVVVLSAAGGTDTDVPLAKRYVRKPLSLDLLLKLVEEFCSREGDVDSR